MKNKQERIGSITSSNRVLLLILACLLVFSLTACAANQGEADAMEVTGEVTEPAAEATKNNRDEQTPKETKVEATISIETKYGTLLFPQEYSEHLKHREVMDVEVTAEIFSMVYNTKETELFRIYFGGEQIGDILGAFNAETGEIPIYVTVCEYGDAYFADEETYEVYCGLMEGMGTTISSIWHNPQFTDLKEVEVVEEEKKLTYWSFSLPENMDLEETENKSNYLISFYGAVNNQRYKLYSLAVGEPALDNILGTFGTDDNQSVVSVESYDLPDMENWSERDMAEMYTMMDSINSVIRTVMSSEGFSDDVLE